MQDLQSMIDRDRSTCQAILGAGRDMFRWAWDIRASAYLAVIGQRSSDTALALLGQHFTQRWSPSELTSAPPHAQSAIARLGGLRDGQLVFTSATQGPALLFCAWWPWSSGTTVSVRIGYHTAGMATGDVASLLEQFKGWFSE